ncbi:MAG: hypothetical protein EB127_27020 [Alphaproteobacteria bacterium]|nr:hypothetical protein [Alphaproteobacteria bacterium]
MKGKTTAKTPPLIQPQFDKEIDKLIQIQQYIIIDLMFVNGYTYLIAVFEPSEYLEIKRIKSKDSNEVVKAIEKCLNFMKKKGFIIKMENQP